MLPCEAHRFICKYVGITYEGRGAAPLLCNKDIQDGSRALYMVVDSLAILDNLLF